MIAKSITVLHNDYGISSDEHREEILKLRAKLKTAEEARLSGTPAYTLEESRKQLETIYQRG